MADRYIRQIEFTNSVHLPDCPVALEKGAVLLDTKTNTYQLQLKLANIGASDVASARIYVEALDSDGKVAYSGLYCDYDEYAAVGSTFGTKKLLPLPGNQATAFRVYVEAITFSDGGTAAFERSRYIENAKPQNIAAEREAAYQADMAKREKQKKLLKSMWGAKWYHIVFAISLVLSIITPLPVRSIGGVIVFILILCLLWVFAWSSMGTAQILKRSAMLAISVVVLSFIFVFVIRINRDFMRVLGGMFFKMFLLRSVVGFIPFLCIFFNARRFDKTLNFKQSLFFWLNPQPAGQAAAQVSPLASTDGGGQVSGACASCGAQLPEKANFCELCGAKVNGQ